MFAFTFQESILNTLLMCNFKAKHVVDLLMVEKNIMMKPQNIGMLYPILKMKSLHFYFLYTGCFLTGAPLKITSLFR